MLTSSKPKKIPSVQRSSANKNDDNNNNTSRHWYPVLTGISTRISVHGSPTLMRINLETNPKSKTLSATKVHPRSARSDLTYAAGLDVITRRTTERIYEQTHRGRVALCCVRAQGYERQDATVLLPRRRRLLAVEDDDDDYDGDDDDVRGREREA